VNPHLGALRHRFQQTATGLRISAGTLIRDFGLNDFLENVVQEDDDAPTLAVRALRYFCEEVSPTERQFQLGVLAVVTFLGLDHAKPPRQNVQQAGLDLVGILRAQRVNEQALRGWITSHFG
jgi:hypothetical protein